MNYVGDFSEDQTVYIPFNTFTSDDPSASATITNLADADIKVHKDGNATEIVTDGATIAINFDGITGNHLITIDTSIDAAYSTGSDYLVRIEGTTVDGAVINAWVGSFSIENRFMRGTDSANTTVPDAAGTAAVPGDAMNLVADAIKAVSYDESTAFPLTAVNGSSLTEAGGTGDHLTAINLPNQTMDITGSLSGSVGSVSGAVGSVTGAVGSVTGHTNQTGDSFAIVNGAAGLVAINADVEAILADTGTDGVLLSASAITTIWAKTMSDLAGVPAYNASVLDAINIQFMALRNKQTATSSAQTIANDAGATIATAALADAAGTTTKEEYA